MCWHPCVHSLRSPKPGGGGRASATLQRVAGVFGSHPAVCSACCHVEERKTLFVVLKTLAKYKSIHIPNVCFTKIYTKFKQAHLTDSVSSKRGMVHTALPSKRLGIGTTGGEKTQPHVLLGERLNLGWAGWDKQISSFPSLKRKAAHRSCVKKGSMRQNHHHNTRKLIFHKGKFFKTVRIRFHPLLCCC